VRCERALEENAIRCVPCKGALAEVRLKIPRHRDLKRELETRRQFPKGSQRSGVWRYREFVHASISEEQIVTRLEGNTRLYESKKVDAFTGLSHILLKHEGENPTGSFKDRGMTVGVSEALRQGARALACASTGNTSASLASYAAAAGVPAIVFIPEGKISS